MLEKKYKVVKCEHCGTLTYKKASFKTIRCPKCRGKMIGDPLELFETTYEAIKYIRQLKVRDIQHPGELFESFG